jgi:hypothetical protein
LVANPQLGKRRKFCRSHPSNENCLVPGRDGAWLSHAPDLGATITGPRADLNLGITTYVNGAPMNPVQLDTSIVATDTIAYVAADQNGLTSTSTRTVLVEAAPSIVPRPTPQQPPRPQRNDREVADGGTIMRLRPIVALRSEVVPVV